MSETIHGWQKVKLSEICEIISGGTPKTSISEYWNGDIYWLSVKDFNNDNRFVYDTEKKITKIGLENSSTNLLQYGDIIISARGTVGELAMIPYDMAFNQSCYGLRAKGNIDCFFLYYLVKDNLHVFRKNTHGSVFDTITKDTFGRINFILPPLPIQKKIAAVLSALDDKIELNNKVNQNLEQQAQAIFKSWFVNFEPFGGKMPDDWKKGKLKDILRLKKKSIKPKENKLPYLPIDIIPMHNLALKEFKSHSEAKSSLITFDKDDILIGAMRVYFHRVVIAPCKGVTRTTCFVLSPFDNNCLIYGLMLCNQNEAIKYAQKTSKGSTMPYAIWDGGLGDLKIIIPSQKILNDFNTSLLPCIKKIQNSYFENFHLAQLRDALLPKLMSGEIDVSRVK